MKSLISDKSRETLKEEKKHAPADGGEATKKKVRLYALIGLLVVVAAVMAIMRPWEGTDDSRPVDPATAKAQEKITSNLRELEEADKRMKPPPSMTAPQNVDPAASQPTSLRGKKPG